MSGSRLRRFPLVPLAAAVLAGCGGGIHHTPAARTTASAVSERVDYLPHGIQLLGGGRISPGRSFAVGVERYGFQGRLYSGLRAQINERGREAWGGESSFNPTGSEPFEWTTEEGCTGTVAWTVVYGLLRNATDRATAYARGRAYRLSRVPIPGRFVLPGGLAYALLPETPSRMFVTNPSGGTVADERLGAPPGGPCRPGETSSLTIAMKKK
jgi:hypothetical protein